MEIHEDNNFYPTKKKISEEAANIMEDVFCQLYIQGWIDLEYVRAKHYLTINEVQSKYLFMK